MEIWKLFAVIRMHTHTRLWIGQFFLFYFLVLWNGLFIHSFGSFIPLLVQHLWLHMNFIGHFTSHSNGERKQQADTHTHELAYARFALAAINIIILFLLHIICSFLSPFAQNNRARYGLLYFFHSFVVFHFMNALNLSLLLFLLFHFCFVLFHVLFSLFFHSSLDHNNYLVVH